MKTGYLLFSSPLHLYEHVFKLNNIAKNKILLHILIIADTIVVDQIFSCYLKNA